MAKILNKRILENLIWIRENMIAHKQDTAKIDTQIEKKRKEIEKEMEKNNEL